MIAIRSILQGQTGPKSFSDMLQQSLEDHLTRCEVETANLTLTIHTFSDSENCKLSLSLEGNIDETDFSESTSAARSDTVVDGAMSSVGFLESLAISIFAAVVSERPSKHEVSSKMSQCADECLGHLKGKINSIKEIPSAFAERAHASVFIFSALAAFAIFTLLLFLSRDHMIGGFVIGTISSLVFFAVFYCCGLFFLPTDFYKNNPKGQLVLAKTGFGSVIKLRVVCAIALPIAIFILHGVCIAAFEFLRQHFFSN